MHPAKIVKRVGEWTLPYLWHGPTMRTFTRALAIGSRRIITRTAHWCWDPAGDRGARWLAPAASVSLAAWAVYRLPGWAPTGLALVWVIAALRAAPRGLWHPTPTRSASCSPTEADRHPGEEVPERPAEPPLIALIRRLIGGDNGVHLSTLYPAMRKAFPQLADAPDDALRQTLAKHGLRVRRSFRAGGIPGRSGVHRRDLPSPTALRPLSAPLSGSEEPGHSGCGERAESTRRATEEIAPGVYRDPDPTRIHYRVTR